MQGLKKRVDHLLFGDRDIRISCPLGTDLRGRTVLTRDKEPPDVSVFRFPVGIGAPIPAFPLEGGDHSGISPTAPSYHPSVLKIESR